MVLLSTLNKQREAVGASAVPGKAPAPVISPAPAPKPAPSSATSFSSSGGNNAPAAAPKNPYATVEDANTAAQDEYTRTGSISPETRAYGEQLGYSLEGNAAPATIDRPAGSSAPAPVKKSEVVSDTKRLQALLDAGEITQDQFASSRKALMGGSTGVDPYGFRSTATKPVPTTTASAGQNDKTKGLVDDIESLSQPGNYPDYFSAETKAALEQERIAKLTGALALKHVQDQKAKTMSINIVASPQGTTASMRDAIWNIVQQGVKDPAQIADLMNKDEQGNVHGSLTAEEVAKVLATRPGTMSQPGATGAPTKASTLDATLSSVIATAPPEVGSFLQSVQGVFAQRKADMATDFMSDTGMADDEFTQFHDLAAEMLDQRSQLSNMSMQVLKQTAEENKAVSEMTRTRELAENETARALQQVQMNAEKRKMEKAHTKRIESMMSRVAVAGGFGSEGKMRQLEEADFDGEVAISEFVKEMSVMDQKFLTNALSIEENYSRNIASVNQNFSTGMLGLVEAHNDKVMEIKKLVFGSTEKRNEAYRSARNTLRSGYIKLQDDTLKYIYDAQNDAADRALQMKKMQYDAAQQTWTHAMAYIDRYGTQNKGQLAIYERELGVPEGSLSNQQTLAEMRMKKTGAGGSNAPGGQQLQYYVETLRQQVLRAHPEWKNSPENVDALVLQSTQTGYSGAKNSAFRMDVKNYVNGNNLSSSDVPMTYADPSRNVSSKPYYVDYKFQPTFEQNIVQVGDDIPSWLQAE